MADEATGAVAGAAKRSRTMAPFTVECGDDNNRTITINTLKLRLRGRWSQTTLHKRETGGRDLGNAMSAMPDIPGICIAVVPSRLKVLIFDPLETNVALTERINSVLSKAASVRTSGRPVTFVPRVEQTLDADTFKTLVLELAQKIESRSIIVVDGTMPTKQEAESLEGRRLNDPWNSSARKPKYADQVAAYDSDVERAEG